jgi:hypothetical protein
LISNIDDFILAQTRQISIAVSCPIKIIENDEDYFID